MVSLTSTFKLAEPSYSKHEGCLLLLHLIWYLEKICYPPPPSNVQQQSIRFPITTTGPVSCYRCIRLVGWRATWVILIYSFAVRWFPSDLFRLLVLLMYSKSKSKIYWRYPLLISFQFFTYMLFNSQELKTFQRLCWLVKCSTNLKKILLT